MMSRPAFSVDEYVHVRNAFDEGRGPAETWARMNSIAWWRLDELAEQAGCRAWSALVASVEPGPDDDGVHQRLQHAVRSAGLGSLSLPAFWRLSSDRITVSRVLVVSEIAVQRAVRVARRYEQLAVVHVQRVPFEQVVMLDLAGEQRVQLPRYDPAAIADALASMVSVGAVAVVYRATGFFQSLLMAHAERRLRSQDEFDEAVAARPAPVEK
jgi:hypothetical protein